LPVEGIIWQIDYIKYMAEVNKQKFWRDK
jgi:hypothetical protein